MDRYVALIKNGVVINIVVLCDADRLRYNLGDADKGVFLESIETTPGVGWTYDEDGFHDPEQE